MQKNVNTEDKTRCRDCNGISFSEHGKLKVIVKYVEVQDYVNTIKLKVSVNPVEVHCFIHDRENSVFRM
jgi:hypothetical protein